MDLLRRLPPFQRKTTSDYVPLATTSTTTNDEEAHPFLQRGAVVRTQRGWWVVVVAAAVGLLVGQVGIAAVGVAGPWQLVERTRLAELTRPRRGPPFRIHWMGEPSLNRQDPILAPDCPIDVLFTTDEVTAEAMIYNADNSQGDIDRVQLREKRPWQSQVIVGVEAAPNRGQLQAHHDRLREGNQNLTFDYEMSYRLDSAVPRVYAYGYMDFSKPPIPFDQKEPAALAVLVTNCSPKNSRTVILQELLRLLPGQVDSFGRCHNNKDPKATIEEWGMDPELSKWNIKTSITARYKFVLAAENANDPYYVTEKYFQAMEVGSVPLVFGAPNFTSLFAPSPNSVIDIGDYLPPAMLELSRVHSKGPNELPEEAREGLARLADRLKHLASDEGRKEYEKMLDWKKKDWSKTPFGQVVAMGKRKEAEACRLAGVVRGESWAGTGWKKPDGIRDH